MMNEDVRDISQKVIEQREIYRPKNIQESYFAAIMSDILLIYYAVDETSKIANEIEAKTGKAISDLVGALLESKQALSMDVLEAQEQIEKYTTTIQDRTTLAIGIATNNALDKWDKKIDERIAQLLNESEKKIEKDVSDGKKEIAKVLNKVNTNKLFAYALVFAICSSLITGLFVFSINQYFFNKRQEAISVQVDKVSKRH
jgi:predicted PurR-regulated permease PerM